MSLTAEQTLGTFRAADTLRLDAEEAAALAAALAGDQGGAEFQRLRDKVVGFE